MMIRITPTFRYCLFLLFLASAATPLACGQESIARKNGTQYGHGSNWRSESRLDAGSEMAIDWNVKVGEGRSQAVGIEDVIYVASGSAIKEGDKKRLTTRIIALNKLNGEEKWTHEHTSMMSNEQETFGGATPSPQATPAIVGPYLIAVSFTGQLICLDRAGGKPIWEKDLVENFGAEPVQFGFSASPVADPTDAERVCIMAAGKSAGFYCLNVIDGSIVWKADCTTCSYATPVVASYGGIAQWVVVTENEVLGISMAQGKRLWRFQLPEEGLTNVPTPLVFDETYLIISGQGVGGTRCLAINRKAKEWSVDEQWFSRKLEFFYTNWAKVTDRILVGCTDKYMAALDVSDGTILGRWRGYGDGNVAIAGNSLLVIDGKGNLHVVETPNSSNVEAAGFTAIKKLKIVDARCWTPISVISGRILIRGDDRLICLTANQKNNSNSLLNLLSSDKLLEFETKMANAETSDPIEQIFTTFEKKGQEAALLLYANLRDNKSLDEAARIVLAEAAKEQDLVDVAKLVISHAKEDFPDSKEIASAAKSIMGK